ncbi:hypothetical protein JZ751_008024 [Albula glossodonta]|uniref:Uncharacterized protein n=1 Tax=Albula glossodonta TaxID=121402 RepID=A0A8T2P4K1_9TELE|nr:hypothetical protein JZ751_008024 [Albula glossodonta]
MDGFAGSLDDSISAASASDVQDRLSSLELRMQQQEDELAVLKAALADVLRRLTHSEDTATSKKPSGKGHNPLREAYSMSCIANGGSRNGDYIKMFLRGRPITMYIPYGYRGRDCRANVYLLPTGESVYFIASVVVLFNCEERTQRHYLGHTDCPLQPHVRVWDSVTLSTLQLIGMGTFERGVGSLAFSKADSGTHLAVVDDSNEHMLTVWDWQKKSRIAELKTTNESVFAVEFHPTDTSTIVTCGKGHKHEKPKFVQCLAFLSTGDIVTGDSVGFLLVWSRSTSEPPPGKGSKGAYQISRQLKAHEGRKGEQFLVGTSRNFILRGTFNDGFQVEVQGHTDELWGLAAHPFKDLFLTCAQDRQVCLWNSVDHSLEWTRLLDESGHCADFHPSGAVVVIGTHSGKWYALDAETRDLVAIHTDGNEQLSVMRYSADGTLLAVGSHDNFIYLYSVSEKGKKYSRYGKCTGHSSYITHLDWSHDNNFIMSNSGDYEILYWDVVNSCRLIRNRSDCKDIDWATYTCVLGFHVFGVWPEGSDGTDINALMRSHNRNMIALADDFCKLHLFQYPCSRPKAPSHQYTAHSSHVTNVTFLHGDSHVVSTGGKDTSIMQWRVVERTLSLGAGEALPLSLGEGLLHNSAPWTSCPLQVQATTPTESSRLLPSSSAGPTSNGQVQSSPDSTPPPSDSTLSPEDSLEQPSDDLATPSEDHAPSFPL